MPGLGYSYTLLSPDISAPPVLIGHALDEADAMQTVEKMMIRNRDILSGIVRDLSAPPKSANSTLCLRGRTRLFWIPQGARDDAALPDGLGRPDMT